MGIILIEEDMLTTRRPLCRLAPCALATQLLCAAWPAQAEEPDQQLAQVSAFQKIEVTGHRNGDSGHAARTARSATRLDLSLRETPQSVSVLPRTLIEDLRLNSVQDLLQVAPGVNVERVETDRSYYTARGFEISNFQIDGTGLPFATGDQLGDLDTVMYERVEVLRGANGLTSFTGNPSATVNFVRKRPTRTLQAGVAATLGSWNKRRLEADVSGAFTAEGTLRGRVIVAGERGDSYLDRYSRDKQVAAGLLEAQLQPDTLLTFGVSLQDNRPQGVMWGALPMAYDDGTPTDYPRSASTAPSWAYWDTRDRQAFAELSHGFANGWRAKATLTRRTLSSDSELFYVYGTPNRTTGAGLSQWPSKYWHTERQTLADFALSGPFTLGGRKHEFVVGLNASRSENALRSSDPAVVPPVSERAVLDGSTPRPAFDGRVTGQADFTDERKSVFAVARWSLADGLALITGANATRAVSAGEQYREPHNYRLNKTNPYVGAVWDFDAHHSLYASHTGIFNPQGKLDQAGRVLPAIEGSSSEVGVKGEWLGGKLNGSVAVFRVKQDNTADGGNFDPATGRTYYVPTNATSTGYELELAGEVLPGWSLSTGFTQLRLKGDDGQDVRTHVPRRTLRLATSYKVPALRGLKVGGALKWQDDIRNGEVRQKAYAVADLMASYAFTPNLELSANLHNIGNTKALTSLQWAQSYYIEPRNGSVTLHWKY